MARRRAREFALQALYQMDMADVSARSALECVWSEQLEGGLDSRPADSEEIEFAQRVTCGVEDRLEEIDGYIETASLNWRLVRMPVVDRNILRLATFELVAAQDVPVSVSINEAVELAKRFGDKDSRAFVNGILDRIASDLGRGGRKHGKH